MFVANSIQHLCNVIKRNMNKNGSCFDVWTLASTKHSWREWRHNMSLLTKIRWMIRWKKTIILKIIQRKNIENSDASVWSLKGRKARWLIYIWRYVDTCIYLVLSIIFVILYCGRCSGIFYSWKTQIRKVSRSEPQKCVIHDFATLILGNSIPWW